MMKPNNFQPDEKERQYINTRTPPEKPKTKKELEQEALELKQRLENPQLYVVPQNDTGPHPYRGLRRKHKTNIKTPISEEIGDVPQYHDPEIQQPWFRKIIKECQPHVHNYRMCLVDEIRRDFTPEHIAREQQCNVLGWNLINCGARVLCGKELKETGWDCYKNDKLNPTAKCEESQGSLNTCLSLNKIMRIPDMIPAHITPDSYLWEAFDERWSWLKETGWGDWKLVYDANIRKHPPFHVREHFKRLELDRERRLVWINRRREKYGHPLFTMQDLIHHEKDLDVYESPRDVPDDYLEPKVYP